MRLLYSSFSASLSGSLLRLLILRSIIEHDNAHVRSSSAFAFVEAVERWPASITETTNALLHLYREKVPHGAPLRRDKANYRSDKDRSPGI
jgi:hypothetical protein